MVISSMSLLYIVLHVCAVVIVALHRRLRITINLIPCNVLFFHTSNYFAPFCTFLKDLVTSKIHFQIQ